jgi:hypothetical protein
MLGTIWSSYATVLKSSGICSLAEIGHRDLFSCWAFFFPLILGTEIKSTNTIQVPGLNVIHVPGLNRYVGSSLHSIPFNRANCSCHMAWLWDHQTQCSDVY